MASLSELFRKLSLDEDKKRALSDIKTVISSASNQDLLLVAANFPLVDVFEYFGTNDSEQLETCASILERLLPAFDVHILLRTFSAQLLSGLSHDSPIVNELCLNQVRRVAEENVQELASYVEVLQRVAQLVGSKSDGVSQKACNIFLCLGRNVEGLALMFDERIVTYLMQAMKQNDTIRYRVYEMVVDVSVLSPESLLSCFESNLLVMLINELNKDDVLVQLNCLELLGKLSLCDHGLRFLEERGAMGRIEEQLLLHDSDEECHGLTSALLVPGIFKFFGGICHFRPKEMCVRFDLFMKRLFRHLDRSINSDLMDVALETVALIGSSADGKMALEKHHDSMVAAFRLIGHLITSSPNPPRRGRLLLVIAQLMHLQLEEQTTELLTLTKDWFDLLSDSPDPMRKVLDVARQPFPELHVPGLKLVESLSQLPWGQAYLQGQPGFKEYLLDRSTETTKEGIESKYEVVRTLVESPTARGVFGEEFFLRLRTYAAQGPFFVQTQSVVAVENCE